MPDAAAPAAPAAPRESRESREPRDPAAAIPRDPAAPRQPRRGEFAHVERVATRWRDNDVFGHLNNAVYYELFDSVVNTWLLAGTGVDETTAPVLGVVVESSCRYLREVAYPTPVDIAVRTAHIGRTSVVLDVALFAADETEPAAVGRWAQVWIDRDTRRPAPIPEVIAAFLTAGLRS